MSNADTSYTARLAHLRQRTQAIFRARNPDVREFGPAGDATPESVRQSRALGQITQTLVAVSGTPTTIPPCCTTPQGCLPVCDLNAPGNRVAPQPVQLADISDFQAFENFIYGYPVTLPPLPDPYALSYFYRLEYPVCNQTSITVTGLSGGNPVSVTGGDLGEFRNSGSGHYIVYPSQAIDTLRVTISNACSSSTTDVVLVG